MLYCFDKRKEGVENLRIHQLNILKRIAITLNNYIIQTLSDVGIKMYSLADLNKKLVSM